MIYSTQLLHCHSQWSMRHDHYQLQAVSLALFILTLITFLWIFLNVEMMN